MPSFSKEQDLKLIKLVEKNPFIYNSGLAVAHRDERELAWQEIGNALQKLVPVCKARWANIRDNMRRNIKLRQKRAQNPYFRGKSSKYKYENYLGFLISYLKSTMKISYEDDFDESDNSETEKTEEIYLVVEGDKDSPEANSSNDVVSTSAELQTEPIKAFLKAIEATLDNLNPYYLNKAKSKIFETVQDCELQQIINKGKEPVSEDKLD